MEQIVKTNKDNKDLFFSNPLIRRIILFSSTLFAVCFSLAVDFSGGSTFADWLVYWTHLSCLAVLMWSFFALISEFIGNEKFSAILESWYWKGLTTVLIIVTGSVFLVFGFLPTVIKSAIHGKYEVIVSTIFLHIITPLLMFSEFKSKGKFSESKINQSNKQKILTIFIVPSLYYIFVIYSMSNGTKPPYIIFCFFNTESLPNFIKDNNIILYFWQILSVGIAMTVAAWFLFVANICINWEERSTSKKEID